LTKGVLFNIINHRRREVRRSVSIFDLRACDFVYSADILGCPYAPNLSHVRKQCSHYTAQTLWAGTLREARSDMTNFLQSPTGTLPCRAFHILFFNPLCYHNFMDNLDKKRHSLSHLLAMAVLEKFPKAKLAIGPIIENGFYYDFDDIKISDEDLSGLEKKMRDLIAQDLKFQKKNITATEAKKIFKTQSYKLDLIKDLKNITTYTSGDFTDLCAGPHIKSTKEINPEGFKLTRIAGAYWRGDEKNKMLTRVYGLAFETKKELDDWLLKQGEAEKRDHRKLGVQLELFMFHETAPAMPYWLPKGLIIINELIDFWRKEHTKYGYREIKSPLINKKELYETSGHWDHYRDNMFISQTEEKETYALKPMNCPNAMVVFASKKHSYRELPLRLSDTDTLHRYERSGTLNGLLRVREFSQDDAHIFISEDQIKDEYLKILEIAEKFYSIFNIKYSFRLGTRPEKFMGDAKSWNKAEKELKEILEKSKKPYSVLRGDGAFYGPKIDILMNDSLGREWQTGTIQLDFQIPKRFGLTYVDKDGKEKTPVVVHRVIYGSFERFLGILIEHLAGAFPVWLSPVQTIILPVSEKFNDYAKKVLEELKGVDVRAEIDESNETLGKKIRGAELQKIPYVLVVGEKEKTSDSVAVRERGKGDLGAMPLKNFIEKIKQEIEEKK